MLPKYYEFYNPVKINAGENALETIPYELEQMNAHKALIVTDAGIKKAGLLKIVLDSFSQSNLEIGAIFDKTPPDSALHIVNEIAEIFQKKNCDSIIAIGGGSVIDTAKAVNIVVSEGTNDIKQFMGADRLKSPQKPYIVIPTTAGTGSEVTLVAVINDTENNVKLPFTSYLLMPKLAVLDPRMTLSLPAKFTAATGMDALTHAVEAYTCLQKNPMSDAYATAAIKLIGENLIKTVNKGKDTKLRFAMANASLMAGAAFSNSMVGAVHAIGHACGGVAHVPHGIAMSILLPFVMQYNMDVLEELYAELLLPLGGAEKYAKTFASQRAAKTVELIIELRKTLHKKAALPINLKSAGVKKEQFEEIAHTALNDGAMLPNPKDLGNKEVLNILEQALE